MCCDHWGPGRGMRVVWRAVGAGILNAGANGGPARRRTAVSPRIGTKRRRRGRGVTDPCGMASVPMALDVHRACSDTSPRHSQNASHSVPPTPALQPARPARRRHLHFRALDAKTAARARCGGPKICSRCITNPVAARRARGVGRGRGAMSAASDAEASARAPPTRKKSLCEPPHDVDRCRPTARPPCASTRRAPQERVSHSCRARALRAAARETLVSDGHITR